MGGSVRKFVTAQVYIPQLVFVASSLQGGFQAHLRAVFAGQGRHVAVHAGPVKGQPRMVEKCETDDAHKAFPAAARVLDVLRCSATFTDAAALVRGFHQPWRIRRPRAAHGARQERVRHGAARAPGVEPGYADLKGDGRVLPLLPLVAGWVRGGRSERGVHERRHGAVAGVRGAAAAARVPGQQAEGAPPLRGAPGGGGRLRRAGHGAAAAARPRHAPRRQLAADPAAVDVEQLRLRAEQLRVRHGLAPALDRATAGSWVGQYARPTGIWPPRRCKDGRGRGRTPTPRMVACRQRVAQPCRGWGIPATSTRCSPCGCTAWSGAPSAPTRPCSRRSRASPRTSNASAACGRPGGAATRRVPRLAGARYVGGGAMVVGRAWATGIDIVSPVDVMCLLEMH